jgi:molybdopterin-guanine dinucleotide biosynthesis protein A
MPGHPAATAKPGAHAVTGLILAGGRGRRLGGIDKGLLDLNGEPLVQRVAQRLAGQVGRPLLSANRNLDRYRALGFAPLTDDPRARVPFDGQRHHYACLLLPRTALAQVETALDSGRRSVRELLHAIGWIGVDFAASDPRAFCNINASADLAALEGPAESP